MGQAQRERPERAMTAVIERLAEATRDDPRQASVGVLAEALRFVGGHGLWDGITRVDLFHVDGEPAEIGLGLCGHGLTPEQRHYGYENPLVLAGLRLLFFDFTIDEDVERFWEAGREEDARHDAWPATLWRASCPDAA